MLKRAAEASRLNGTGRPPLRFHDLRHTFAGHLIVDLCVAQVSRIMGHASITITLDVYTHLFDHARHVCEIRERIAESDFARLISADLPAATISALSVDRRDVRTANVR